MIGGDVNPYPVLLLVNYWELSPSATAARLDELIKRGITQIGTFVPWQAAESDISHAMVRFLQAAADRQMSVFLILSPEVGIHYPNSGLPKDLISKKDTAAFHCQAERVAVHLPPNSMALPSYFSGEFNKRYYGFLARMDGIFHDLLKNSPGLMKRVTVTLTGSFWKYYRSGAISSHSPFSGNAGDYSTHAALAYRQRTDHLFSQREFSDPTPAAATRWKTRSMEDTNRKWFYQHAEDVFRSRSARAVRKRSPSLRVAELELFTPEADPSLTYHRFFQMISNPQADFNKLEGLIDECANRTSGAESFPTLPFIHWSSMGNFRNLSESEKQFLILKSLLLLSTRGGGILMEDTDWLALSPNFRIRIDSLLRSFTQGEFELKTPALYLAPHLWSYNGTLWDEVATQLGPQVRMVASVEVALREKNSHLLVVDPSFILTREAVQKLTAWAKAGRVAALPRSALYTEAARAELERVVEPTQRIEVTLGLTYFLHALGDGKLVVYDVPTTLGAKRESLSAWQNFVTGVLSIAEIQNVCRVGDKRLSVVSFDLQKDALGVFIMNSSRRHVQADILFPTEVSIADLGIAFSHTQGVSFPDPRGETAAAQTADKPVALSNQFSLNVPPLGVLPLRVDGINFAQLRERQIAALTAQETQENAMTSALSELPGLALEGNLEELWS